jgi:hypothetical protein
MLYHALNGTREALRGEQVSRPLETPKGAKKDGAGGDTVAKPWTIPSRKHSPIRLGL